MFKLESLTFNNIRCFTESQTVLFSGRDKLIQVDGRNENTGGSSGAGKTTIFLALDYLLGISSIPATVLQSRLTKDPIAVSGIFEVDGKKVEISRSKKHGLTIKCGENEVVSGNVKIAEEKLDELLGIPRKLFKKMVHKHQKEGGFFLEMTAKEVYEFLVNMLGLNRYLDQVDTIGRDIVNSTKTLETTNVEIDSIKANIVDLESIISKKHKPQSSVSKDELEKLGAKILNLEGNLSEIKQAMELAVSEIQPPVKKHDVFDETALNELVAKKTTLNEYVAKITKAMDIVQKDLHDIPHIKKQIQAIKHKVGELEVNLEVLQHSKCPTCEQVWLGDSVNNKIKELTKEIEAQTSAAIPLKKKLEAEPSLLEKQDRLGQMQINTISEMHALSELIAKEQAKKDGHNEALIAQYNQELLKYNEKVGTIKHEFEQKLKDRSEELSQHKTKHSQMSYELESFGAQLDRYNSEIKNLTDLLDSKKAEIIRKSEQIQTLTKRIVVAGEARRLVKTYVLHTFQDTLDSIGDMATDILSAIPNMASSTVYFEGCKENKDGSIKDEITAIVNMDGNNKVPIKSFSGGERTAIDLAVDLAVIDIIESKTGKGADFFVIDEPFDGLDSICKENCLEIIKQVDTNKKIIMVDHSSELKEMVSDVITVIKSGESSTVAS